MLAVLVLSDPVTLVSVWLQRVEDVSFASVLDPEASHTLVKVCCRLVEGCLSYKCVLNGGRMRG